MNKATVLLVLNSWLSETAFQVDQLSWILWYSNSEYAILGESCQQQAFGFLICEMKDG